MQANELYTIHLICHHGFIKIFWYYKRLGCCGNSIWLKSHKDSTCPTFNFILNVCRINVTRCLSECGVYTHLWANQNAECGELVLYYDRTCGRPQWIQTKHSILCYQHSNVYTCVIHLIYWIDFQIALTFYL